MAFDRRNPASYQGNLQQGRRKNDEGKRLWRLAQ